MRKKVWAYLEITLALIIIATVINMFLGPHAIAAGGASGIGILFEHLIGISRSYVVMGINVIMLVLALFFLGTEIFKKSAYGSFVFPICLYFVPEIMLLSHRILSMVIGSIIFAIGVMLLYRNQASSGGTTIPPLIFAKFFNLNTAIGLLITDLFVVCASFFVFGFNEFVLAGSSVALTSLIMLWLEHRQNKNKPRNPASTQTATYLDQTRPLTD